MLILFAYGNVMLPALIFIESRMAVTFIGEPFGNVPHISQNWSFGYFRKQNAMFRFNKNLSCQVYYEAAKNKGDRDKYLILVLSLERARAGTDSAPLLISVQFK